MSDKQALIEWIQQLPDDYGLDQLLDALHERYNQKQASHQTKADEDYEWPTPDLTEDEWQQVIVHSLRAELADSREDIYTLEDGAPANEEG